MKKKKKSVVFKNMKKTFKYTKGARWFLVIYTIAAILDGVIGIVLPIVSAKVILNITGKAMNQLILVSLALLGIEFLRCLVGATKSIAYRKLHQRTVLNVQSKMIKETLNIEVSEIDKQSSGLFIDRLNKDASDLSDVFGQVSYWTTTIISNIGVLVAIFILNKYLFIYAIFTSLFIFLLSKKKVNKESKFRRGIAKLNEEKTGLIAEAIRGIRDVKVLNAADNLTNQTTKKISEVMKEEMNLSYTNNLYSSFETIARSLTEFFFIVLGVILYNKGLLTIPAFVIAYHYQPKVRSLLNGLSYLLDYIKQFEISSTRIYEIIDNNKFKKEKFGTKEVKRLEGNIEFRNVSFGYNKSKKIIKNMSFKVNPNEKVAFVGKSGAGKSTLFSLIAKLYPVNKGEILLDNINIKELTCSSLRDNMSIITQSPYIFNFTIKENLLLAKSDATMNEIREVCKLACIDDYIMSLPEKYNTQIGENGVILSGGQKQRLAIARALLMKTEIILFDEATSALDNETQRDITKAIENLKGEYTILIVAHRLSTVIDCDKIFIVDDGKIIDVGTHKELMKKSEFYRNLYESESI